MEFSSPRGSERLSRALGSWLVAASLSLLGGCNMLTGAGDLVVENGHGGAAATTGIGGAGGATATVVGAGGAVASTVAVGGAGAVTTAASTTATASVASTAATTVAAATTSTGGPSNDPAQLCVDTINMYRATRGLPPYTRWTAEESCVDGEATTDGNQMSAHYAFIHGNTCNSYAENECPNWAMNPLQQGDGIVACLGQMWDEKNQPGCSGCDNCDFPYQGCTNCEADGATVCGHYLDMKSSVLSMVACGFAGGWYTQNFAQ